MPRDVPHYTLSGRQTTGVNDHFGGGRVHGLGTRPSRADLTPLDLRAIWEWTARNARARACYFAECGDGRMRGGRR